MKVKNNAGEFSDWLDSFIYTMKGEASGDVPCGECVGCCTSSKFIHIRPTDVEALALIPSEILFAAPGLPEGHQLMGYSEKGHCPMFVDGKCSIYKARPETCRQYDCRVLQAAGVSTKDESQVIAEVVKSWEFQYSKLQSRQLQSAVLDAVAFLRRHADLFPAGFVPVSDSHVAVLAVRIHHFFLLEESSDSENPKELRDRIMKHLKS